MCTYYGRECPKIGGLREELEVGFFELSIRYKKIERHKYPHRTPQNPHKLLANPKRTIKQQRGQ